MAKQKGKAVKAVAKNKISASTTKKPKTRTVGKGGGGEDPSPPN